MWRRLLCLIAQWIVCIMESCALYFCEARIKRSQRKRKRTTKMWLRTAYLKSHPTVSTTAKVLYFMYVYANKWWHTPIHPGQSASNLFFGVSVSLQLVVMVNTVNTCKYHKKSPWSSPPLNWGVYRSSWRKPAETPSPWLPQHPGYSSLALWPWVHKVNHHGSPQLGNL